MAYGNRPTDKSEAENLQTICAVLVAMYSEYEGLGNFHSILVSFSEGSAVVGAIGHGPLILVLWAQPAAQFGLIQAKVGVLIKWK